MKQRFEFHKVFATHFSKDQLEEEVPKLVKPLGLEVLNMTIQHLNTVELKPIEQERLKSPGNIIHFYLVAILIEVEQNGWYNVLIGLSSKGWTRIEEIKLLAERGMKPFFL